MPVQCWWRSWCWPSAGGAAGVGLVPVALPVLVPCAAHAAHIGSLFPTLSCVVRMCLATAQCAGVGSGRWLLSVGQLRCAEIARKISKILPYCVYLPITVPQGPHGPHGRCVVFCEHAFCFLEIAVTVGASSHTVVCRIQCIPVLPRAHARRNARRSTLRYTSNIGWGLVF